MKLAEVLHIPPFDQCCVAAGEKGLDREILSINSYDAPDVINWIKPDELVLTSGYVFKKDEAFQVKVIQELADRQCAGIGMKTNYYFQTIPGSMIEKANELDIPLIEIPYPISLSDLILAFLKEMFKRQELTDGQLRKKKFFSKLFEGKLHGRDTILAEGKGFGLLPGKYICLCAELSSQHRQSDVNVVMELIERIGEEAGVNLSAVELKEITILLQVPEDQSEEETYKQSLCIAESLVEKAAICLPHLRLFIGIGSYHIDVLKIGESFQNAQKALYLGNKMEKDHSESKIYDYRSLEAYDVLQHVPKDILEKYSKHKLESIIRNDQTNPSNLLETLEVYLSCYGNTSQAARRLGVHRNTINFRISRIQELLGENLENGDVFFQLQLALHIYHLLSEQRQSFIAGE